MSTTEDKKDDSKERIFIAIINGLESSLKRMKSVRDPMSRNLIMLDRILTVFDGLLGFAHMGASFLTPEVNIRAETVLKEYQKEMELLLEWVQQPSYSPDHFVGNNIINQAQDDFTKQQEKL